LVHVFTVHNLYAYGASILQFPIDALLLAAAAAANDVDLFI